MNKVDIIKKLLKLASNNPSEEEAQTAMKKAQKLALDEGLFIDDLVNEKE